MTLDNASANLVGTLIEVLLFGAYSVVFAEHMQLLYKRRSRTVAFTYLLSTSIVLYLLSVMHMGVDFARVVKAYTERPLQPEIFFSNLMTAGNRAEIIIYFIATLVSDLFVIYRCFIIWDRSYMVAIVPFLLFLAAIGLTGWSLSTLFAVKHNAMSEIALVASQTKNFYVISLVQNVLCTALIAIRLWSVHKGVKSYNSNLRSNNPVLPRIFTVIVESAAIYSSLLIVLIVTNSMLNALAYIFLLVMPPVIGLVFSVIIVRSSNALAESTDITERPSILFGSRGATNSRKDANNAVRNSASPIGELQIRMDTVKTVDSSDHEYPIRFARKNRDGESDPA